MGAVMTEAERRRFEVLLEQVLHEVRAVAEGHDDLRRELERFRGEVNERFEQTEAMIRHAVDTLREEIRAVDEGSQARDERMLEEIRAVRELADDHESRIGLLEQRRA
jgi:cell division septum initiation protein DivIVA